MAREPGAGWRRGWGYMGGWLGVWVLPAPGLGLQPSCQPSPLHGEGSCTCLGGLFPITEAGASCAWPSWELGANGGRVLWISAGSPWLLPWLFP